MSAIVFRIKIAIYDVRQMPIVRVNGSIQTAIFVRFRVSVEIGRYTILFESRWLMKRRKQMIAFARQLHETLVRGHGISRDGIKFDSLTTKQNRRDILWDFPSHVLKYQSRKKKTKGSLAPSSRRNLNTYVNEIKLFKKKKKLYIS